MRSVLWLALLIYSAASSSSTAPSSNSCPATDALQTELAATRAELTATRAQLRQYRDLEQRPLQNNPWVNEQRRAADAEHSAGAGEDSDKVKQDLLDSKSANFPEGHNTEPWHEHLAQSTPGAFSKPSGTVSEWASGLDCRDPTAVVVAADKLAPDAFNEETAAAAAKLLDQCGFVYLDNFFSKQMVNQLREAYTAFKATDEAREHFAYPVQGEGREEFMLPFRSPFNDSYIHDDRLLRIMKHFLRGSFKMELQTIINSKSGAGDQRWHQGWRYMFHPEEQLPPFAAVVTLPLVDVEPEMGPTEICPGKKLRFYRGWSCPEGPVSASTTLGTVTIFDYKTLHRGPANKHREERPMLSLVFSRSFFLNGEAIVNRAVPLMQTLHQRRYWESYFWHPEAKDAQMMV